jgi:hypothetical protein
LKAELEIEYADLAPGESRRDLCPQCGGGESREKTFVVTKSETNDALLFFCFRSKCRARGAVGGSPTRLASFVPTRPKRFKTKPDPSGRFIPIVLGTESSIWELSLEVLSEFGAEWDNYDNRLALPVYGPIGAIRGWVLRDITGTREKKVLAYPTKEEPQLGWNRQYFTPEDVVVVEDIPSAIRLGQFGVRAVALNGTHLTEEATDELVGEAQCVVFALDRDAFDKAKRLEKQLRIHFDKTACLLLPKDFKNQNNEEVVNCLSEISWLHFSNPEKPMKRSDITSETN